MTITNRNLEPGTRLVATYKKTRYVCTVQKAEAGESLAYVLEDGSRFKSPSSAAMKVMGGKAVNGWRFWTVEGDEEAKPAAPAKADKATPKLGKDTSTARSRRQARNPAYKVIHVHKSQEDLADGEVRWACDACIKSWVLPAGEEPTECPNGHRVDDAELNTGGVQTEDEAE